jgi:hypothetical protein
MHVGVSPDSGGALKKQITFKPTETIKKQISAEG